jgi:hypothetical protein
VLVIEQSSSPARSLRGMQAYLESLLYFDVAMVVQIWSSLPELFAVSPENLTGKSPLTP